MADFKAALAADAAAVSDFLDARIGCDLHPPLADAMRYGVVGGKALRGFYVMETARLHGIGRALPVAAAIECVHAYSLIHDDLPAMDDDDMRRGRATVHKVWDDATAILAGDALQALAFELIGEADFPGDVRAALMMSLARQAGVAGMVGGQAADIAAETAAVPFTLDEIIAMQGGKTGALLTWSCMAGAMMAQADVAPLKTYGDAVGLAFQIADDVLDVTGDAAAVGKAVGKDEAAGKATFVSLLGLDGAKGRAVELVDQACDALSVYGDKGAVLKDAARFVVNRSH
ncbi:polyprenyl synthetase family protein [Octadecabacter sp. G9-8]|uniref:Polyprenyl synthetase family protein n=1 Tax=Octadecabacter dasysiphoniae TaxID=2909341 RepID=A0ABS9CW67_9RHOB|nr:polyprenyl synthetase family protein [Octadecabacter dasysiphoniae]MCF2871393.1 polyprenyl synthetase family protein [Octadecabacter dasysiphoniae]